MADEKKVKKDSGGVKITGKEGACPWCQYSNDDEAKGPLHEAEDSKMVESNNPGNVQCGTCGKHWDKKDLGKPWTLELECGPKWARDKRVQSLDGNRAFTG